MSRGGLHASVAAWPAGGDGRGAGGAPEHVAGGPDVGEERLQVPLLRTQHRPLRLQNLLVHIVGAAGEWVRRGCRGVIRTKGEGRRSHTLQCTGVRRQRAPRTACAPGVVECRLPQPQGEHQPALQQGREGKRPRAESAASERHTFRSTCARPTLTVLSWLRSTRSPHGGEKPTKRMDGPQSPSGGHSHLRPRRGGGSGDGGAARRRVPLAAPAVGALAQPSTAAVERGGACKPWGAQMTRRGCSPVKQGCRRQSNRDVDVALTREQAASTT